MLSGRVYGNFWPGTLQLKHRITRFRCDNGKGKYDNESFRSILIEYGITFESSSPYMQHKNGVSERMIQTHNAKARAMVLDCIRKKKNCVVSVRTH